MVYCLYTALIIKSPSFLEEKFSVKEMEIAALTSKARNDRAGRMNPPPTFQIFFLNYFD